MAPDGNVVCMPRQEEPLDCTRSRSKTSIRCAHQDACSDEATQIRHTLVTVILVQITMESAPKRAHESPQA